MATDEHEDEYRWELPAQVLTVLRERLADTDAPHDGEEAPRAA